MPELKIDKAREERIRNEIIVDPYNEFERFSGLCHSKRQEMARTARRRRQVAWKEDMSKERWCEARNRMPDFTKSRGQDYYS
jgi:hypothetical protein